MRFNLTWSDLLNEDGWTMMMKKRQSVDRFDDKMLPDRSQGRYSLSQRLSFGLFVYGVLGCAELCYMHYKMLYEMSNLNEWDEWDRWLITFGGNFFIVSLSSLTRNSLRFSVTIGVFIHNFVYLLLGTSSPYWLSDLIMFIPFYCDYD